MAGELGRLPEKRRLSLIDKGRGIEVQPYDIGIGISQVLPVVVAAIDKKSDFIIIEQPELHIHPGLQVNMGDLFISQIQDREKTFILETHSEHLLLRLLRRIRETHEGELPPDTDPLTPEQLSVNYIEPTDDGLRVRQLMISKEGDSFGEWPKGFFEERARELL
jgi:predicted ATPase